MFYISQYFQVALGYSPIRSGVSILPILVTQTAASFVAVSRNHSPSFSTVLNLDFQGMIVSRTGRYRVQRYFRLKNGRFIS